MNVNFSLLHPAFPKILKVFVQDTFFCALNIDFSLRGGQRGSFKNIHGHSISRELTQNSETILSQVLGVDY